MKKYSPNYSLKKSIHLVYNVYSVELGHSFESIVILMQLVSMSHQRCLKICQTDNLED